MRDFTFVGPSTTARAPTLPPKRRLVSQGVDAQLRTWIRDVLLGARVVSVDEWVSCDVRTVAHTVCIGIETERGRRHCVIHKASERIVAVDVRSALANTPDDANVARAIRALPRSEREVLPASRLESP